jgi:hypothetical protein
MADSATVSKARRGRTMMSLPCGMEDDDDMAASFIMDEKAAQFADQNVHISTEGLTINGVTISDITPVSYIARIVT